MNDYVSSKSDIAFELFGFAHAGSWLILVVVLLVLALFRDAIRQEPWNNLVRYGLAAVLMACEAALQVWSVAEGVWDWRHSLPMQLCSITLILSALMLWRRSYRLFEFVYFAGIAGALQALATPDLDYGFPHVRFLLFMTAHTGIIAASVYMAIVEGYRPKFRTIGIAMLWLNGFALLAFGVNILTGGNYMFLMRKPIGGSLLDVLGPWPWYLLAMEMAAALIFVLLYMPFALLSRRSEVIRSR
ncbi:conserved hypothetical integral membrane protein TIGR02206 [Paenibacillus sp. UNCCL117]|uniref:YwaF family protein n=1 Tax=unclassified Paenibacillus TaxID=185978 RepID=UPI0008860CE4|nr:MULTISPECIES: TIGR02206 family membrane protein [unclassified Paenibacillus]SDC25262.1 conserved hypothetical integral membrane protein TIGR02206 [Paenibacillus sp. cl123]SFW19778.1 conserved hypothetical integral membrane protein TIGR02206 [Paenibacillus sp. UNCCL117]